MKRNPIYWLLLLHLNLAIFYNLRIHYGISGLITADNQQLVEANSNYPYDTYFQLSPLIYGSDSSYSLPHLHRPLWDVLLISDIHFRLIHWVRSLKTHWKYVTWLSVNHYKQHLPSVLDSPTKEGICLTNKAAKYQKIWVLVAQRAFRDGRENRKHIHKILTKDFWQSSAHTNWQFWE